MADGFGLVPFTQYFPQQSLAEARMQGEQLRATQGQRRQQEAKQQALSDIYGTPEEAARQQVMGQQQDIKTRKIQAAGGLLDSLSGAIKDSGYDPEVIKRIKARQDIRDAVSPLVDLDTYEWSPEGDKFVYGGENPLPATVDGKQGQLEPGSAYIEMPDGTYKTRAITAKEKREIAGKPADTTALVKNTEFIAKTLKIPREEALGIAMESKTKSRDQFIQDYVLRAVGLMGPRAGEKAAISAAEVYDSLNPEEKESVPGEIAPTTEPDTDWLGSQEEVMGP
jgi:hypothetical protein